MTIMSARDIREGKGATGKRQEPPVPGIDPGTIDGKIEAKVAKRIAETVEKHPREALAVLRGWMSQRSD